MAVVQSQQVSNASENSKPKYGKVVLTLENCILPPQKLSPTPSSVDGLEYEAEVELRILGCELIQTSGILLRLPQVAMATGQVLYQRFYYSKSFVRHSMEIVAMACVTLASKIEEAPRRIRDVINVFHHIKQVRCGKTIQPLILDINYINLKNQVIKAERRILKELGFCVHVKHPHKIIVLLLQVLECEKNKKLMQTAWNYMNDSLRSDVFVRYQPEAIACACIYLSARVLRIALPVKPAWHLIFGVTEESIRHICSIILNLYKRKKPDQEKLEKMVEDLRKAHQEAKLKAKNISGNNTPVANSNSNNAGFSPNSRPTSPSSKQEQSPHEEAKKEKDDAKNNSENHPAKPDKENHTNQVKRRHSVSPHSPSPTNTKKIKSVSSSAHSGSASPSPPKHKAAKTPPRSYKEPHSRKSRSRSHSRDRKESSSSSKHHASSHKRRRSHSRSRSRSRSKSPPPPPSSSHRHTKKSHKEKSRRKSRSHSRERNHHSAGYSHKSRKDRAAAVRSRSRSRDRRR